MGVGCEKEPRENAQEAKSYLNQLKGSDNNLEANVIDPTTAVGTPPKQIV